VINGLVEKGNSVIVIEHNLDVIKTSDWIIDMGPEGGSGGGTVVAQGTPEEVAAHPTSYTGSSAGAGHAGGSGPGPARAARRIAAAS
jgi:excinuclease ABC subunit A